MKTKKYDCVLQEGPKDCGVCCLLTIIRKYNGNVSKEYLRNITNTTKDGVNAYSLLTAGRKIGFYTKGVSGDILDIDDKYLPCIAHVIIDNKYKHFVVIHKIDRKNNNIVIADPAKGLITMDIDKFKSISTNNYLLFLYNKKLPYINEENIIRKSIMDIFSRNKKIIITIILFSILYIISNMFLSFNIKFIVNYSLNTNSKNNLFFIMFIFAFIYAFKSIVEYERNILISFLNHKLDFTLINESLFHILSLPHLYFKNRTTGEVVSRISDLEELKDCIVQILITCFIDLLTVLVIVIILFSISFKLALITIIILLVYSVISVIFNKIIYNDIRDLKEKNTVVNSSIIESINGIDTIKSLNIIENTMDSFLRDYNNYLHSKFKYFKKENIKSFIENISFSLILFLNILIGGIMVIDKECSISDLFVINSILLYFFEPIRNLLNYNILMKRAKIITERINELLNIEEEKIFIDECPIKYVNGSIKINNLNYCYGSKKIINNFSYTFNKGSKIMIYGSSGSGKSTLAKIISGYIKPSRNKVFIGDTDITDLNLWNIREQITYVSQNEFLFTNTIYNNINLKYTRDITKIKKIIDCMLVNEIIKDNPSGYNMMLEENGNNISGGERQRIILARAFLKNSNYYILDESFSQIDSSKERVILNNIFNNFGDKTIIVISHRFDNNDLYDNVINMEEYEYC